MDFWNNFNFNFSFDMGNWFMPSFNFQNFSFPTFSMPIFNMPLFPTYTTFFPSTPVYQSQNFSIFSATEKDKSNTSSFNKEPLSGYNSEAGKKLADIALKNKAQNFTGWCAKYVKNAIQKAGLGIYQFGHAYQMTSILRNNRNFKEISPNDIDVKDLPAGCILVYGKGVGGYSSRFGHTEITTGKKTAISDGVTTNLNKKPSAIFIPIERNYLA